MRTEAAVLPPERMPFTGNVAWATKLGSENMSSSLTTKRRKVSSGSNTVNTAESAGDFHSGFRPLSPAEDRRTDHTSAHLNSSSPLVLSHRSNCSPPPLLTVDDGLELLFCVATQLDLHEGTDDAAARLGKVSGSDHLHTHRRQNCSQDWDIILQSKKQYLVVKIQV